MRFGIKQLRRGRLRVVTLYLKDAITEGLYALLTARIGTNIDVIN